MNIVRSVVRTIYAAHLSTCKMLNRPFTILPNSTLNQKFNLYKDELPLINEYPAVQYVAIGNKGATYEVTTSGMVLTTPTPHLPRDAALFNHIPFVVRNINDDISSTERVKYRMRVPITIEGTVYVAYYLRALNMTSVTPGVQLRNVDTTGNTITTTNFVPVPGDLSPTPPDVSNIDINDPSGDYLVSSAVINLTLNQEDIANIMEGCAILYGDPRYAVISEIALCSGVDKVLSGTFGSVTSNYTEVIAAQVTSFIAQYHALSSATTKVDIDFDVGTSEALLI